MARKGSNYNVEIGSLHVRKARKIETLYNRRQIVKEKSPLCFTPWEQL